MKAFVYIIIATFFIVGFTNSDTDCLKQFNDGWNTGEQLYYLELSACPGDPECTASAAATWQREQVSLIAEYDDCCRRGGLGCD